MKITKTITIWVSKQDLLEWARWKYPKEKIKKLGDAVEINEDGGNFDVEV